MAEARDIDRLWALATGHFAGLGFARCNYGVTRFRQGQSIGNPEDRLFLTTLDEDYVRHYLSNGFFARTPLFRWADRNEGACTWAWVQRALEAGELSADEAETVRQNAARGITAGITVAFPQTSARSKGALGLIANPGLGHAEVEAIWAASRDSILAVAHLLHLAVLQHPIGLRGRGLTARQREVLEWVADGKTTQDTALVMGVTPAMVEKHLRLAREALAVDTTAQAVAKALLLNLIFQPDRGALPSAHSP